MADEEKEQVQQDVPQDQPQDTPQEEPQDTPKEDPKDEPKDEPKEETPEEPEQAPEEPEAKAEEPQEAPKEPKPRSRRAQKRIDELAVRSYIDKLKREEAQAATPTQREDALDYRTELDADPEVIERLEADRNAERQSAYTQVEQRMKFNEFKTNLRIDAPQVESEYKFLNPKDKANFEPGLADALNRKYLTIVGYDEATQTVQNTNLGYADFIRGEMETANWIATRKTAQSTKNVAKQVANTGLRPGGEAGKSLDLDKHPKDMTDEELAEAAKLEAKAYRK